MLLRKLIIPSFIPAVACLVISTVLLVLPGTSLPGESWMGNLQLDKLVHIIMFAALCFLWCMGFIKYDHSTAVRKRIFMIVAIILLLYGLGMEFVQQYLVVNRSFDLWDVVADAGGCLAGLLMANRLLKKN